MIKKLKMLFGKLFTIFDHIDLIVLVVFASIMFFSAPVYLMIAIYQDGYFVLSILVSIVTLSTFAVCIRDLIKKRWSYLSIISGGLWAICFLRVAWEFGA
nr:putative integron gene cassette protein [uncultured bacterium]